MAYEYVIFNLPKQLKSPLCLSVLCVKAEITAKAGEISCLHKYNRMQQHGACFNYCCKAKGFELKKIRIIWKAHTFMLAETNIYLFLLKNKWRKKNGNVQHLKKSSMSWFVNNKEIWAITLMVFKWFCLIVLKILKKSNQILHFSKFYNKNKTFKKVAEIENDCLLLTKVKQNHILKLIFLH